MVRKEQIKSAIEKSCDFLLNSQEKDGSWITEATDTWYILYQHPIILTSEAIQALIFAIKPQYIPNIQRGLYYCLQNKPSDKEDIDIHAWRLMALNFSDSPIFVGERMKIRDLICSQQTKQGYWIRFPATTMLTNFSVVSAIKNYPVDKEFSTIKEWLVKNKAKDGFGWGFEPGEKESRDSSTAEAILTLLYCGEPPTSEVIQKARKYLESTQFDDGYWHRFRDKSKKSVHVTATCVLALMLTSENPFSKHVENGIKFILSTQTEGGYYLRKAVHVIYYVHFLLNFYMFLKNMWNLIPVKTLREGTQHPQNVTLYLFRKFDKEVEQRLNRAIYSSVVNSQMLGTTSRAVKRRIDILKILNEQGAKTTAEIIDSLKQLEQYKSLSKKSHLTQIKSDVDFLRHLKLINEHRHKFYSSFKII